MLLVSILRIPFLPSSHFSASCSLLTLMVRANCSLLALRLVCRLATWHMSVSPWGNSCDTSYVTTCKPKSLAWFVFFSCCHNNRFPTLIRLNEKCLLMWSVLTIWSAFCPLRSNIAGRALRALGFVGASSPANWLDVVAILRRRHNIVQYIFYIMKKYYLVFMTILRSMDF